MAWYADGDWTGLRVDRMGHCLAEMMYAINEREVASGHAAQSWGITAAAFPSAADFNGTPLDDAGGYLTELQNTIGTLIAPAWGTHYVRGDDGSNWAFTDLLEAAGYGDAWLPTDTPISSRPFLQLKAVIELLRYLPRTKSYTASYTSSGYYHSSRGAGDFWTTAQEAWDNRRKYFESVPARNYWEATRAGGPAYTASVARLVQRVVVDVGGETLYGAEIPVNSRKLNCTASVAMLVGGVSVAVFEGSPATINVSGLASTFDIQFETEEPSICPFVFDDPWDTDAMVGLEVSPASGSMDCWVDVSGGFTYG